MLKQTNIIYVRKESPYLCAQRKSFSAQSAILLTTESLDKNSS